MNDRQSRFSLGCFVCHCRREMEEICVLKRELNLVRERYARLLDAHRDIQNRNCLLEERILEMVEKTSNAEDEIHRLKETIQTLENDQQRYRNNWNLVIRFLQQNAKEFLSQTSTSNLIIPTFPPTYATAYTLVTNQQSPPTIDDDLNLIESLLKHSSHDLHTIEYSDASVQTCSVLPVRDDHHPIEPYSHMTRNDYRRWYSRKSSQDITIPMPQMHTV